MMKKLMSLSIVAIALFSLTACPSGKKEAGTDTTDTTEQSGSTDEEAGH